MQSFFKESFPEGDTIRIEHVDLTLIKDLSRLLVKGLSLEDTKLSFLDTHSIPQGLTHLCLNSNQLRTDGFSDHMLSHLKVLLLDKNRIQHLSQHFSAAFPNLETLSFSDNAVKDTCFLGDLPQLKNCRAERNNIQVLQCLPPLLEIGVFMECGISMMQSKLPRNMWFLSLAENKLHYAGLPLHWSPKLKQLNLSHNCIERFPRKLPDSLEWLDLSHNELTALPEVLPASLKYLNVSYNRIRKLPNWKRANPIDIVILNNNCITEKVPLELPWAKSVYDANNWNSSKHHIAQRVIRKFWYGILMQIRLRNYRRSRMLLEELMEVAMQPSRCHQIDTIHQTWFTMHLDHNRTDHLKD